MRGTGIAVAHHRRSTLSTADGLRLALGAAARERVPPHATLSAPINLRDDSCWPPWTSCCGRRGRRTAALTWARHTFAPATPTSTSRWLRGHRPLLALRASTVAEPPWLGRRPDFVPHATLAQLVEPPDRIARRARLLRLGGRGHFSPVHLRRHGDTRSCALRESSLGGGVSSAAGGIRADLSVTGGRTRGRRPAPRRRRRRERHALLDNARQWTGGRGGLGWSSGSWPSSPTSPWPTPTRSGNRRNVLDSVSRGGRRLRRPPHRRRRRRTPAALLSVAGCRRRANRWPRPRLWGRSSLARANGSAARRGALRTAGGKWYRVDDGRTSALLVSLLVPSSSTSGAAPPAPTYFRPRAAATTRIVRTGPESADDFGGPSSAPWGWTSGSDSKLARRDRFSGCWSRWFVVAADAELASPRLRVGEATNAAYGSRARRAGCVVVH